MIRETLRYGFFGALSFAALTLVGVSGVAGQTLDFGAVLTNYSTPESEDVDEADPRVLDLIEASNTVAPPSQEILDAIVAGGPAGEAAIQEYLSAGNPSRTRFRGAPSRFPGPSPAIRVWKKTTKRCSTARS